MNPEQKEDLERAASLESIEAFQRDVEPAIIRARNKVMTRDNYRSYDGTDYISQYSAGDQTLYRLMSRSYDFDEHDPERVREAFDAELKPLGLDLRRSTYASDGGTTNTVLAWTSERYGVTVHVMVSESWLTSVNYYTGYLRSDGTSTNPQELADIPGREPEWFAEVAPGTES